MSINNILNKENYLHYVIRDKIYNGDNEFPINWKALVVDVDYDGKKFIDRKQAAIRIRIFGLHDHIKKDSLLPIAYPKNGITGQIPEKFDWVWITYQSIKPIGRAYWDYVINDEVKLDKNSYERLFK